MDRERYEGEERTWKKVGESGSARMSCMEPTCRDGRVPSGTKERCYRGDVDGNERRQRSEGAGRKDDDEKQ